MERKVFRDLSSIEESKERLGKYFQPLPIGAETVPLDRCAGRVLADNIEAATDVPPFDRAAMDGFAVQAEDTYGAEEDRPTSLTVVGEIGAGETPTITVHRREAVEISTGAPIPKGANAVVMVEYTWQSDSSLKVYRAAVPGENIMAAGSDIMAGELVLRKGDYLTSRETGVLAALGLQSVTVFKKPLVAILSTGNELVSPGDPLSYGKIYDVNARTLADSITENGGIPLFLGIVGDNAEGLASKCREGILTADMLLTSGSTSAGVGDLLYRIINELGEPGIVVHGVTVRPGKPVIIAVVEGKPIFGLPGYPTSALMMFNIFVRQVLRKLAGLEDFERRCVKAITVQRIFSSGGRREYLPVSLIQNDIGEYVVYPVPGGSGSITTLAEADGFIEMPKNQAFFESGERIDVELFNSSLQPADLMVIGSHCVGIDVLSDLMRRKYGLKCKIINTGSSGGLVAVRRGEADVAGTHLLDEVTGIYNLPFLERFEIEDKAVLIRGYRREQGLVVPKGNPKNIRSFEDFVRGDIYIINRNPGSGTRVLVDMHLKRLAKERGLPFETFASKILGYRIEAKSHSAVVVAVLHGKADVGIAIRAVAEKYALDFIPIAEENYDFLVRKDALEKEAVRTFLEILKSAEFKDEIRQRTVGLTPTRETGFIIYPK